MSIETCQMEHVKWYLSDGGWMNSNIKYFQATTISFSMIPRLYCHYIHHILNAPDEKTSHQYLICSLNCEYKVKVT